MKRIDVIKLKSLNVEEKLEMIRANKLVISTLNQPKLRSSVYKSFTETFKNSEEIGKSILSSLGIEYDDLGILDSEIYLNYPLPKHIDFIENLLHISQYSDAFAKPIIKNNPYAFEEFIVLFVIKARTELAKKLNQENFDYKDLPSLDSVSRHAYLKLEHFLFKDIYALLEKILYQEFKRYSKSGTQSNTKYADYIRYIGSSKGLLYFFNKYPVLARLISIKILDWVNNSYDLLSRIESDKEEFRLIVPIKSKKIIITNFVGPFGDAHLNNKFIAFVDINSKYRIVYKPRNIEINRLFEEFLRKLDRICKLNLSNKIIIPKSLYKKNYGWTEYIFGQSIENNTDLLLNNKILKSIGYYVALMQILGTIDMHYENFLIKNNRIYITDVETIINCPVLRNYSTNPNDISKKLKFRYNLANSGFLPNYIHFEEEEKSYLNIGLFPDTNKIFNYYNYVNVNSDKMQRRLARKNTYYPQMQGDTLINVSEQITKHYIKLSKNLLKNKLKILNLISDFRDIEYRRLFRPTSLYSAKIKKSLTTAHLKSSVSRSLYIYSVIGQALLFTKNLDYYKKIIKSEIYNVEKINYPIFFGELSSKVLIIPKIGEISNFLLSSPSEYCKKLVNSLSNNLINENARKIKIMILSRSNAEKKGKFDIQNVTKSNNSDVLKIIKEDLDNIYEKYIEDALPNEIYLKKYKNRNIVKFISPPSDIYMGSLGILLILLYGYIALKQEVRVKKVKQKIRIVLGLFLQHYSNDYLQYSWGIDGIGGILIGLSDYLKINPDKKIQDQFIDFIILISEYVKIDSKTNLDLLQGVSGLILGQIKFLSVSNDNQIKNIILKISDELNIELNKRLSIHSLNLGGFSHGVSGIAYALLKIYKINQNKEFLITARKLIDIELSYYKDESGYVDKRFQKTKYSHSWCNGTAGISITLFEYFKITNDSVILNYLEKSVKLTLDNISKVDCGLCCGTAGQIDILSKMHEIYLTEEIIEENLKKILQFRLVKGHYAFNINIDEELYKNYNSLYKGNAGIMYLLLKRFLDINLDFAFL